MIKKYSYGHLMILEISSDQQKRPAGLIKRETGVNPVRSRHCDSWFRADTTGNFWEGALGVNAEVRRPAYFW